MEIQQAQWDSLGLDSRIYSHFQKLLKYAYPYGKGVRSSKNLFQTKFNSKSAMGIDDSVLIYDEALENPIVFYNESSSLSLPIAALKMVAISALKGSDVELRGIIEAFNIEASDANQIDPTLTPMEFFNGRTNLEGKHDPEFYKMLKVKYGQKSLEDLALLIASKAPEEDQKNLLKSLMAVMNFMDPTNLTHFNTLLDTNRSVKGQHNNQVIMGEKLQIQKIAALSTKPNRKLHYNITEQSGILGSANNIINFLNDKIQKNVDIIRVVPYEPLIEKEGIKRYIVPTYWKVMKDGVFIRG
ncbi:MAG: hypothetical protein ACOH2V_01145 [Candidatus Saccharimonadaceae bacterium]